MLQFIFGEFLNMNTFLRHQAANVKVVRAKSILNLSFLFDRDAVQLSRIPATGNNTRVIFIIAIRS